MEAIERDIRIGNGTKKMQEISKIFNKSSGIPEFKIKLSLAGLDFDKAEQEYTRLVASKWPKFLEMLKHLDKDAFSFKRYMDVGTQTNAVTKKSSRPKLPCNIKRTNTQIAMKTAGDASLRKFVIKHHGSFEALRKLHGIDFEADMVRTMLYELAF